MVGLGQIGALEWNTEVVLGGVRGKCGLLMGETVRAVLEKTGSQGVARGGWEPKCRGCGTKGM